MLPPGWPLAALFYGFPLWWALGLAEFIFYAAAVPMALELCRRRSVRTPRWFGLWVLFLLWVLLGIATLWTHAPGTQYGGGPARLINFGLHYTWYLAVTVALLYVYNLSERELSARRLERMLAFMFVITALFGLAGTWAPNFEFKSMMEYLLPGGMSHADFIHAMIHPALASASDLLGYDQPRPIAPFMYANAWGNNLALFAPMFIAAWFGRKSGWRAFFAPVILLIAAIPVVLSLNRGVWIGLSLGILFTAVRLALAGKTRIFNILLVAVLTSTVLFVASPLYDTVTARLAHPHSNERRGNLASDVLSTVSSSPVIGYGGTRQKQGGYSSIAAGDSTQCPSCAPPALGTQGFLWFLLLSSGYVGTALCLLFLLSQFLSSVRRTSTEAMIASVSILMSLVFFLVYQSLGSALFTLMLAIGLHARPQPASCGARETELQGIDSYVSLARRHWRPITTMVLACAAAGVALSLRSAPSYVAQASVMMSRVPAYVDVLDSNRVPPEETVDTDAQLVTDPDVTARISGATGVPRGAVPAHITVTAAPLTRVLYISFAADTPRAAERGARVAARASLTIRRQLLPALQPAVLRRVRHTLATLRLRADHLGRPGTTGRYRQALEARIRALDTLAGQLRRTARSPGEVIVAAHQVRESKVRPVTIWGGSGAAIGLMLGLGAASLGEALGRHRNSATRPGALPISGEVSHSNAH